MVFQNYALYAHMSVRDNMGFGLKMARMPKPEVRRRVDEAAEVLGLVELLDRKPKQLSGGQRQRVAMGRAIVREPSAFLMDEPLSNLDAKLRVEMRGEIIAVQRRIGAPTLYVTHDQVEAMTMGDRVAILRNGVLEQLGTPDEIYDAPANIFVAGFIGSPAMNLVVARLERDGEGYSAVFGDLRLAIPRRTMEHRRTLAGYAGGEVIFGIRPEDFSSAQGRSAGEVGVLDVDVKRVESLGSELLVYLDAGRLRTIGTEGAAENGARAETPLLTARLERRAAVEEGRPARVAVDLDGLYFFDPQTGAALA
jgi:multiple sugar transport system ATP-binding protein